MFTLFFLPLLFATAGCGQEQLQLSNEQKTKYLGKKGTIELSVSGFRNHNGNLMVSLFSAPDGFPDKHEKAIRTFVGPINGDSLQITFKEVDYGLYSISFIHDENGNKELDKKFLGIPTEGYGVSNNVKPGMGPPSFKEATFLLDDSRKILTGSLNYL